MTILKRSTLAMALVTLFLASRGADAGVILDDSVRGAYDQTGVFATGGSGTSTGNYLTGFYPGSGASTEFRSFFTFDLTSVAGPITSAQFNVAFTPFSGGPSPVTLNLVLYSGNISTLDSGGAGAAGVAGLSSGTLLGSATVSTSATGTLGITLNAAALASIQAAEGGNFAIGGSLVGTPPTDYLFAASSGSPLTELVLNGTAVPEPSSMLLMACGLMGIAGAARRRLLA